MCWIRGALYIITILVVWYFVKPIVSYLTELTGNQSTIVTFVLFVAFGPLVAGWLGSRVVNPLFKNWQNVKRASRWEDRLVRELAPDDDRGFPVVLVPWPSEEVKTFALLSDTYQSPDGEGQLASVYIPGTPDPSSGVMRVVLADKLVFTDWAMRDLLQYQWSFGATGPKLRTGSAKTRDKH
jgi:uncharacterized membrane protein